MEICFSCFYCQVRSNLSKISQVEINSVSYFFLYVFWRSSWSPRWLQDTWTVVPTPTQPLSKKTPDLTILTGLLLINITLTFNIRQVLPSQTCTLSSALVRLSEICSVVLPWTKMAASSAYICTLKSGHTSGKSLIYKENNRGPRIDPCGTPTGFSRNGDLTRFITTHCLRFDKYDFNQRVEFNEKLKYSAEPELCRYMKPQ